MINLSNLIGLKVRNIRKGDIGIIKEVDEKGIIYVKFEDRIGKYDESSFVDGIIKCVDEKLQKELDNEIAKIKEKARIEQEKEYEEKRQQIMLQERKQNPNENMVFRSQFCDGGTKDCANWFKAPCSEECIDFHINDDTHNTWCKRCSKCAEYVAGTATKEDITQEYKTGFLCYESRILLDHCIKAGWDVDSATPRSWNLKDGHLAVLMTTEPGKEWSDAIIYSVFLTDHTTIGDDNREASTCAAKDSYIDLTLEEARNMRLWEYMPAVAGDNPTFWGSGLFRYISDDVAARILHDVVEIVKKRGNKEEITKAENFLNNFLMLAYGTINKKIPPKCGPLK